MKNNTTKILIIGLIALIAYAWYIDTELDKALAANQEQQTAVERYKFLVQAGNLEHKIIRGEMREYRRDAVEAEQEGYRRGYSDGSTNMGVAMINDNESFVNYSDGYHAALHL